jgi:CopG-like RHH_1 or ribbon-helix-helix domain, RHH_5
MKVQITLSEEMTERIDIYAKKVGVSRSALCGILIGQGIMAYDKAFDVINAMTAAEIAEDKARQMTIKQL